MLSIGLGSPGIHELLEKSVQILKYDDYDLPLDIMKRGVDKIPKYHFRDDALEIWYAMMLWVKSVVGFFYTSDADISGDLELQDWIREIYRQVLNFIYNSNEVLLIFFV